MDKEWKEFEIAVANFLKAADPNNKVNHDVYLPDKHTKKRRQRDVFLETNLCGFLPIKVLISCKRYKRRLNQQDIDAFNGELISSGAHKGIIYSYSGFNENAIEKCKTLGISCCKLYQNKPADLPEVLLLDYFCCIPTCVISLIGPIDEKLNLSIWENAFTFDNSEEITVEDINNVYLDCEKYSLEHLQGKFPISCYTIVELINKDSISIKIKILCTWKYYRSRYESSLINGSYSFSDKTFSGEQTSPILDIKNPPGEHWTLLEKTPDALCSNYMVMTLKGGNIKEGLLRIKKDKIKIELG